MAATQLRLRRGTSGQHNNFSGAAGEITVVTDDWSLRVHDGVTAGGHPISGGGGGGSLSGLSDVDVTTSAPADGDVLVYSSASGKWEPGAGGGGGGGGGASYQVDRFLSSGTWTKPANLQFVRIIAISPGSGGGAGSNSQTWWNGSYRGGFGGRNGRFCDVTLPADCIPSTVAVTIGAPGQGGAGNAEVGTAGGSVAFGPLVSTPTGYQTSPLSGYGSDGPYNTPNTTDWFEPSTWSGSSESPFGSAAVVEPPAEQYAYGQNPFAQALQPSGGGYGSSTYAGLSWNYGTLVETDGYWKYTQGGYGGAGFTTQKTTITQLTYAQRQWGRPFGWGRGTGGTSAVGSAANVNGYDFNLDVIAQGNPTGVDLEILRRQWWGDGGGGGGNAYVNGSHLAGNGGTGSFPGGGGGGGASNPQTYGTGGNGGSGVVYVYSYIGTSAFAWS